MLRKFLRSSPITHQVDCSSPKGGIRILHHLKPFSHLAKVGCPCYLEAFCQTKNSYKLCSQDCLRSERSCYLRSCEFIRIREKEPVVPTTSFSMVPAILCGLVPVCGSAIVRTAGWSSCSSGQPSPTYGSHPT